MTSLGRALAALSSAALVLLIAAPVAIASPSAGKLSIRPWPQGYFGFVKTQPGCVENRSLVIYQRVGKRPDPSKDQRLAQDRAELLPRGGSGQWGVRAGTSGPAYVVAPRRGRCGRIVSRVLEPQSPRAAEIKPCSPDQEPTTGACRFDRLHLDLYGSSYAPAPCPSLTEKFARCAGYPREGLYPWGGGQVRATEVEWRSESGPGSDTRSLKAWIFKNNTAEPTFSYVEGYVASPGSATFRANMVAGPKSSDRSHGSGKFFTPDLPGMKPGEVGGPLYINFENGNWGADIHIWGYLFER